MRRLLALAVGVCTLACVTPATAVAQEMPSIASKIKGLTRIDGFMPLYWDETSGKLLLEIGRWDTELLYQISLAAGLGSNPVGLDRGALGDTHVVVFQRIGPKVLMIEPNYRYRALTTDPAERRAVQDSFARSVLWGFKVEASEGQRVLVDATALFLRDAFGAIETLRRTQQGSYRLDESRSAIYLARTKVLSQEHRDRNHAHAGDRWRPGTAGVAGDADAAGGDAARASFVRRAAAARRAGRLPSASR